MALKRFFQDVEAALDEQEAKRLRTEHGFTRIWNIIYYQVKNWFHAPLRTSL